MGRGGKLNVNIDAVRLADGEKVALRAVRNGSGDGHAGAMAGGMLAAAIIVPVAAPLFLLMHGKDVSIPKGTVLRGIRALVVDDNATNRFILRESLRYWGMLPETVAGGLEALDAIRQARDDGRPFALLVLDVNMPEMDGFGLVEEIRRNPELTSATIMMLSSSDYQAEVERCREQNIGTYLTKPVSQPELRRAISRALGMSACEAIEPAPQPPSAEQGSRIPEPPRRILLVEDNVVNQRVAVRLLEARGYELTVAANGLEALAVWETRPFDLILMDVQMPEMDGFEAAAEIRRREAGRDRIPIIALTANAFKGDREKCLAAGMDDYIPKPINSKQLDKTLEQWIVTMAASTRIVLR